MVENGKEAMPSCSRNHPLRALPYFGPSCQGTTGLLTNLDFSIDGRPLSSFSGTATFCGGPCPAVFPGNPKLWRLQGGLQALELLAEKQKYLPPSLLQVGTCLPPLAS